MTPNWKSLPRITIPSPVLALAADQDGIWAGGLGCIMWRKFYGDWEPKVALTGVATIAPTPSGVLVGSSEGLLFTEDHGDTWQTAQTPPDIGGVIAIALSPDFANDGQVVAATTQKGVLRSADGGRTWQPSQLIIVHTEGLLWSTLGLHAATNAGIYHSLDNGHVWQAADACFGQPFVALSQLGDGRLVAASEAGQLWLSEDGQTWHQQHTLPTEGKLFALFAPPKTSQTLLASIAERGLYFTTNAGETWRKVHNTAALSLASWDDKILAGLTDSFQVSHTGGISWVDWPTPQLHDLHKLEVIGETAVLIGHYTTPIRYQQGPGWQPIHNLPRPTAAHTLTADNTLLIATTSGFYQSTDAAETWEKVSDRDDLSHLSSRDHDQTVFAAVTNGSQFLSSSDNGRTWQPHNIPFGEASLVALTAMPHLILAATYQYDPQQVIIWLSGDSGKSWQQAAAIPTNWPLVTAWPQPSLLTVGNLLLKQTIVGWQPRELNSSEAPFRTLAGHGRHLFALTTEGLWHSADKGISWEPIPLSVQAEYVVDIAATAERIYLLYIDGQVLYRPLTANG